MKKFALIVAGGSGQRMRTEVPKQFIELAGQPVLMHTFYCFKKFDPKVEFILVLPKEQVEYWNELCNKYNFNIPHKVVFGGNTRFHSVKNGLAGIKSDGIVFIHDGVRPLVSVQTIQNCYNTAMEKGNALPVVSVTESVRFVNKDESKAVDRSKYFLVQTPQTFQTDLIKDAYQVSFSEQFTDDASVLETQGTSIQMVDGNRENIKITLREDLIVAKAFLIPQ